MTDARRADAVALLAILLAGCLSAVWAFVVPIFQAPDEPAHFDYAISIYNAHGLVRVSDGRPAWIASPYTKYLMRATDWERIAWHSSMRAPAGYGSHAYFARLDAGAPSLRTPTAPNGTVNYIAPYYPFAFYGLEALWMHAASLLNGSIATTFFAARLLCVFLTMLGLYFNYRTALNLGIPRWTSVALVAAVGFFPLTTFVSSYVQPDNLAYMLVSATLFFATALRAQQLQRSTFVALGLSLGLLAVTKYHIFIAVAIPVLALAAARLIQSQLPPPRRWALATAAVLPTVALLFAQYMAVNRGAGPANVMHSDLTSNYLLGVMAQGIVPALRYAVVSGAAAFMDCFVTGGCAATFWQTIGWVDTPIVIVSPSVELWLRTAIGVSSLAAAVILIFFACRNSLRVIAAALRGHVRAALSVATGDPVLNSYLCFMALIIALYIASNNVFGAEGRQLYPFIFPAFLCFVWYAPRALRKEHRTASGVLAGALLAYALVASAYATADLRRRYYSPSDARYVVTMPATPQVARQTDGVLFPIVSAEYHVNGSNYPFGFTRGMRLLVDGSALLPGSREVPSTVAVLVDGRRALPVLTNQYLYTIAEATHSIGDGYSAFYAPLSTLGLQDGAHVVTAYAKVPGTDRYDPVPPARVFFMISAGERLSASSLHEIDRAPTLPGSLWRAGACNHAVALFAGKIAPALARAQAGAWLLVDRRPYPARLGTDGSFVGAVTEAALPPGRHRVTAYAIDGSGRSARVVQGADVEIGPRNSMAEYLRAPSAACADPLAQLELG